MQRFSLESAYFFIPISLLEMSKTCFESGEPQARLKRFYEGKQVSELRRDVGLRLCQKLMVENFVTWEESCDRNPHPYPLKDHQYQTLEAIT